MAYIVVAGGLAEETSLEMMAVERIGI